MGMGVVKFIALLVVFLPVSSLASFDHTEWGKLLQEHVVEVGGGVATQVDYKGMLADRNALHAYLADVASIDRESFESWSQDSQLAFLINAYNAWTVELILTEYPRLASIKDIGFLFSSPWRQKIVSLFGEQVSLDDIEHRMIRGWNRYHEPRIHFAVNCAAIGCPSLRAEAYEAERLEQQLEDSTRLFLSDKTRNYVSSGRLYISSIFKWYEEDFEQGWLDANSVSEFLARYVDVLGLDAEDRASLGNGRMRIRHLKYDWRLNSTP